MSYYLLVEIINIEIEKINDVIKKHAECDGA